MREVELMAKRLLTAAGVVVLAAFLAAPARAQCARIQDGTITDTKGNPVTLGFDMWGYIWTKERAATGRRSDGRGSALPLARTGKPGPQALSRLP
jgi:hypothetical protein